MPRHTTQDQLIAEFGNAKLDDLFAIEDDALRQAALNAWIAAGELLDEVDMVKIVPNDGKRLKTIFVLNGKPVVIDHNGRRVRRKFAVDLLTMHGVNGQYYGIDPATAFAPSQWDVHQETNPAISNALSRRLKALGHWPNGEPQFQLNYLTHLTDADEKREEDAA